ncbi:MAG: polymer-forming cytoskeletal protein [bacterium]
MFGKDASSAGDGKLNSIIGRGSQCEGEIVVAGGLKVDGRFKGKIKADSVFVGKEAVIEANVETNVAVIGGKVQGDVTARESLELQAKSELVGNVKTKNLIVGESAILDGYCDMGQKERHAKKETEKKPTGEAAKAGAPAGTPGSATPAPTPSGRTDKR